MITSCETALKFQPTGCTDEGEVADGFRALCPVTCNLCPKTGCVDDDAALAEITAAEGYAMITSCETALQFQPTGCTDEGEVADGFRKLCPVTCDLCGGVREPDSYQGWCIDTDDENSIELFGGTCENLLAADPNACADKALAIECPLTCAICQKEELEFE